MTVKKRYIFLFLFLAMVAAYLFARAKYGQDSYQEAEVLEEKLIVPPSALNLGLEIDVVSFERVLDQNIEAIGALHQEENLQINNELVMSYQVRKKGPSALYPENGKLRIKLPLDIDILAKARAPIAIPVTKTYDMNASLMLDAEVSIDFNEDWTLNTDSKTSYTIGDAPEIRILGKKIQFRKQLEESIEEAIPMIDQQIEEQIQAAIDTRAIAESIWDLLKEPYQMTNDPFNMYATLYPNEAKASPIIPSGPGMVSTQFAIATGAQVYLGEEPIPECLDQLPGVNKTKGVETPYSYIHLPLYIKTSAIVDYVNTTYAAFEIQLPKRKKPMLLSNFQAERDGGRIKVTCDFSSGKIKGLLNIKGVPVYNASDNSISIEELYLSSESNNVLVDEFIRFAKKSKGLKQALRYDLDTDLSQLTYDLTNTIQSTTFNEYSSMKGYVDNIKINQLLLQDDYMVLDTTIKGQLTCSVSAGKLN